MQAHKCVGLELHESNVKTGVIRCFSMSRHLPLKSSHDPNGSAYIPDRGSSEDFWKERGV